jgi:cytochrome c553
MSSAHRAAITVVVAIIIIAMAGMTSARAEPPVGAAACTGCHPASARGISPVVRLAGLDQNGIVKAMQDFRAGRRVATVMDRIAKGFTDEEIQAIAAWYASQR